MEPHLPEDNAHLDHLVLENLRVPMYKISGCSIDAKVTTVTSYADHIFVGTIGTGLVVFRYKVGSLWPAFQIGASNKATNGAGQPDHVVNVYEVSVTSQHLVYLKEENNKTFLCVHKTFEVLSGRLKPARMLEIKRKAPMAVDSEMGIIVIGGVAWTSSWTSAGETEVSQSDGDIDENSVRVLDLSTFDVVREFKATDNAIAWLRLQATSDHNMLGVADTRTGIRVYDLRQPTENCYSCLYKVPVDEIRNFYLLGDFVGVFHKFEPNVSFWNMHEQKTILCINIQDQMRQLAQEFLDEDDDMGLYETEDDHVTSVCGVKGDNDIIVIYGTRSGCIFGMSVNTRRKLFNIPCPYGSAEGLPIKKHVQGIAFLPGGKLAVAYEKQGLTILDFGVENPPDRPPTRQMRRPKTS